MSDIVKIILIVWGIPTEHNVSRLYIQNILNSFKCNEKFLAEKARFDDSRCDASEDHETGEYTIHK